MPDQDQRYERVNVGDDELVIYDKKNGNAWVQSDCYITLESVDS